MQTTDSYKWELYDSLIQGVPEGIEVTDCCLGLNWSYVLAESGCGISHTVSGGGRETFFDDPRKHDLRSLCELVKSWNFSEATLGVAALNAWYSQTALIEEFDAHTDGNMSVGMRSNPFNAVKEHFEGKNVAVIGHFPQVDELFVSAKVTVLERCCSSVLDTPDTACEYVLPTQDFVLMTGITLTNKTMPRLLELTRQVPSAVVGPSAIPALALRDKGVDIVAGSIVVDPEAATWAIRSHAKPLWRHGIKKFFVQWGSTEA